MQVLLLCGTYYALAELGYFLFASHAPIAALPFPVGLALGLLLRKRAFTRLYLHLVPIFVTQVTIAFIHRAPISSALLLGAAGAATPLFSAWILRAGGRRRFELDRLKDVFSFFLAVATATLPTAALAALASSDRNYPVWVIWLTLSLGQAVVSPFVLIWTGNRRRAFKEYNHPMGSVLLLIAFVSASVLMFGTNVSLLQLGFIPPFLLLPLFAWAVIKYEAHGVTAAVLVLSITASYFTMRGAGPFAALTESRLDRLITLQLYLSFTILSSLPLAIPLTERRRESIQCRLLNEELRKSEEFSRATFDLAAIGKVVISPRSGRLMRVNERFSRMLGYTKDELMGKTFTELTHPDDLNAGREAFRKLVQGEIESYTADKRYFRKGGEILWATLHSAPIRDPSGNVTALVTTVQDITDRKLSEQQRQDSLRRFQELVDSIDGIVWEATKEFRFIFVSKQAETILGYPVRQWLDQPTFWIEHIHPDDREAAVAYCLCQAEALQHHDFEYRMIAADGRSVWLRDIVHVMAEDGRLTGLRGIMVDVTHLKTAETKLKESEARKSAILDSALDCIITINQEGRITEFNRAAEEEFGYKRSEAIGQEMAELIIPLEFRDAHRRGMARFLSTGESNILGKRVEMVALHADGSKAPVELSIVRVPTDGPPLFTGFVRNITERKEVADRLRRSESRLKAIVQNEPECVKILDSKGVLLEMNPAGLAMIEASGPEHALGRCIYPSIAKPYRDAFRDLTERVCQGESGRLEFELIGAKGTRRWMETNAVPLFDEQTGKTLLLAVTRDITEKKRAEELRETLLAHEKEARIEAERSVLLRDEFLSIASHELRTPLTPIRMHLQLIKRHLDSLKNDSSKVEFFAKSLENADREFERFLKLVDNLLDVSRITAGRMVLDREECDLTDLVRSVIKRFGPTLAKDSYQIILDTDERARGKWDRTRIEQVVTNLLSNAMKYGEGKPIEISISMKEADTSSAPAATLVVRDHGIGIEMGDLEKVFGRFERIASVRHFGGFGLGLYISRNIVTAHGGSIRVESEPGKGSTFTVTLPLHPKEQEASAA